MSLEEALSIAHEQELDLVEINPDTNPPVAKLTDWGKYNYQKIKQLKKNKKASKVAELKQVRLGLKIGEHDLQIKLKQTREFIENKHKVKFMIMYKGREQAHKEIGFNLANKIIEDLGDKIILDQAPAIAGRQLSFVVRGVN